MRKILNSTQSKEKQLGGMETVFGIGRNGIQRPEGSGMAENWCKSPESEASLKVDARSFGQLVHVTMFVNTPMTGVQVL